MFENDSWLNWLPDPQRAFREHDPTLEPYASMSQNEILDAMLDARGGHEWEFLIEFLLDKCSPDQLVYARFMSILRVYGELGLEEFRYLTEVAGMATRVIPCPRSSTDDIKCVEAGNPPTPHEPAPTPAAESSTSLPLSPNP